MRVLVLLIFIFSSCSPDQVSIEGKDFEKRLLQNSAAVTNVKIENNQLKVQGTGLEFVKDITIKNESGFSESFAIESASDFNIVANSLKNISILVGGVFSLVLSNAHGAATFQVGFTLQDGAVEASHLSSMGAQTGQVLKYNGTNWVASDLDALMYAGTWDASTAVEPNSNPVGGEYYIVSNAGNVDIADGQGTRDWQQGDWIVYNSVTDQWDQIVNAQGVETFNGRTGAVNPQAGDYNLSDLGEVNLTGLVTNKILKYNGTEWIVADDLTSGGGGSGTGEADNVVLNADNDSNSVGEIQFKIDGTTQAVIDNNGNFGIGTASPNRKLTVDSGSVNTVALFRSSGDPEAFIKFSDSSSTNDDQVGIGSSGDDLNLYAGGVGVSPPKLTIKDSGNVGIGTTSPVSKLSVSQNSSSTSFDGGFIDSMVIENIDTTNGNMSSIGFVNSVGSKDAGILAVHVNATGTFNSGSQITNREADLHFQTADSNNLGSRKTKMIIKGNGNIGVGTLSPTAKLEVVDTVNSAAIKLQGNSGVGGTTALRIDGGAREWQIGTKGTNENGALIFFDSTASTRRMTIDHEGRVGIGTGVSSLDAMLDVVSTIDRRAFRFSQDRILNSTSADNQIGTVFSSVQDVQSGITNTGYVIGIDTKGYLNGAGTVSVTDGIRANGGTFIGATGVVNIANGGNFGVVNQGTGSTITEGRAIRLRDVDADTGYGVYQEGVDDNNYFAGNIGVGTTTPQAKLEVAGQIKAGMGTPATDPSGNDIDFITGNTQYATFTSCPGNALTVDLFSMLEGGSYTLVVIAPAGCLISFTGTSAKAGAGGGVAISDFKYPGGNTFASTGNPTVYSILRANNFAFVAQVGDYQ